MYEVDVFSACINARSNSHGGGKLSAIYNPRKSGMTAMNTGDSFRMRIKGLDVNCNKITKRQIEGREIESK